MPGKYDPETRTITLQTDFSAEPKLTTATLINCVVQDLLYQNGFGYAHFPELVDLAVIGTGLGMLQSTISFVNNKGTYWDTTQWEFVPKPFLDIHSVAYANAITAWVRGEQDPAWANDHSVDVKKPMKKSLKFLHKTNDSFFQLDNCNSNTLQRAQNEWLAACNKKSESTQLIAIRHIEFENSLKEQQETLLAEKLRSGELAIVLHSITAAERAKCQSEEVANELRFLVDHRDDQVRAKALCALGRLKKLDELSIDVATKNLDHGTRFVVFSGIFALASQDEIPEKAMLAANKGFVRALQKCDYEFIGLYVGAYNRWLEDPETHITQLLEAGNSEYIDTALEALQNVREELVSLSK